MTRRRRLRIVLPLALAAIALCFLVAPPAALAHATVLGTEPAHGEQTSDVPESVVVTFDEPVSLPDPTDSAQVIDQEGERIDSGEARLDPSGTVLTVPLPGGLPRGIYIASWRVTSADSHVVGGSIQFGVRTPARAAAQPVQEMPDPALTIAGGTVKAIVHLGLAGLLGLLPAALLLAAGSAALRRVRGIAEVSGVVVVLASLAQAWVQFLGTLNGPDDTITWAALLGFVHGRYALAVIARVIAVTTVLVLWPVRGGRARWAASVVAALVAVGSVVVNGHGGAGSLLSVGFVVTTVHVIGAILWFGGLVLLGIVLLGRDGPRAAGPPLRLSRWTVLAAASVATLGATGIWQAVGQVGHLQALLETDYGRLLLAKLALVAAALLLAGTSLRLSRRRASDPSVGSAEEDGGRAGGGQEDRALPSRTRREAGLVALIVLTSGVLSSLTPARAAWSPSERRTTGIGPYTVDLEIAPARVGQQVLRAVVTGSAEHPEQPATLEAALRLEGDGGGTGIESLEVPLSYRLPGTLEPGSPTPVTFVSSAVGVPAAGRWTLTLTLVVDRLEQYTGAVHYEVR